MEEQQTERASSRSLREWLAEGERLYHAAQQEYQELQNQLADIEARLDAKREEINQVAQVIGKSPVEPPRRQSPVQIIEREPAAPPSSRNTIAKALTGRGLG